VIEILVDIQHPQKAPKLKNRKKILEGGRKRAKGIFCFKWGKVRGDVGRGKRSQRRYR